MFSSRWWGGGCYCFSVGVGQQRGFKDFKVFVMHLSNVFLEVGGGCYCFSVGVGQQRGSIYLFMISDPLSSVIEIEDLGITQSNQSLPSII